MAGVLPARSLTPTLPLALVALVLGYNYRTSFHFYSNSQRVCHVHMKKLGPRVTARPLLGLVTDQSLDMCEVAVPAAQTGGQKDPGQGAEEQVGQTHPLPSNAENGRDIQVPFLKHRRGNKPARNHQAKTEVKRRRDEPSTQSADAGESHDLGGPCSLLGGGGPAKIRASEGGL